jgi:hypothetical protein
MTLPRRRRLLFWTSVAVRLTPAAWIIGNARVARCTSPIFIAIIAIQSKLVFLGQNSLVHSQTQRFVIFAVEQLTQTALNDTQ